MAKNKNNQTVWSARIKKNRSSIYDKVGSSLEVDKRLFKEDIACSIAHVEMLHKQKILSFKVKNKILFGLNRIKNQIIKKFCLIVKMRIFICLLKISYSKL